MKNKGILSLAACVGATLMLAGPASADQDRVSGTEKGSLLIYSKIEVRWDGAGNLVQDTFVDISNDASTDVRVKMYLVNGDAPWNWLDNVIELTANQPKYWSAATGDPANVSPIEALGARIADPEGSGDFLKRGFLYVWALDSNGQYEAEHDHLKGDATLINYRQGYAWEYNAWGIQQADGGTITGDGTLNLDGSEYAKMYSKLILDFYAVGSSALSSPITLVTVSTDLTLHPVTLDVRQETEGPTYTKAQFDIWNEDETKFTNLDRCILCWDQTLLANYGTPNHFLLQNLQTDKGKARIDGVQSKVVCDVLADPEGDRDETQDPCGDFNGDLCSEEDPLLGVQAKFLTIAGGARHAAAGGNLIGLGLQDDAFIKFDTQEPPDEASSGGSSPSGSSPSGVDYFNTIDQKLKKRSRKESLR